MNDRKRIDQIRELIFESESIEVEFKCSISGLSGEDLVAFANSEKGGNIFIGIDENKNEKGEQEPIIVGCEIGDKQRLQIQNKANDCRPGIPIQIFQHELEGKNFFRIEIPSGPEKPYSTKKGVYKIRSDTRNKALEPEELLTIFLKRESDKFVERFRIASSKLLGKLENISEKTSLVEKEIINQIALLERLEIIIEDVFSSSQNTEDLADEAMAYSDSAYSIADEILGKVEYFDDYYFWDFKEKIDLILKHLNIEDPKITHLKENLRYSVWHMINDGMAEENIIKALASEQIIGTTTMSKSEIESLVKKYIKECKNERKTQKGKENAN